jgi:LysM repeat protein
VAFNKSNALLRLCVDIQNKALLLYQDDQLVRRFPIVDLIKNLPIGKCNIDEKIFNPKPTLGTRWLGFDKKPSGIHGTPIGKQDGPALGVVLSNEHIEDLYTLIPLGTFVEITKGPFEFEALSLPNQFGRFPATPLAFPVVPGPHAYIVQRGDTIWKLSKRFQIPMDTILATNLLADPNRLEPGQILHLPITWPK